VKQNRSDFLRVNAVIEWKRFFVLAIMIGITFLTLSGCRRAERQSTESSADITSLLYEEIAFSETGYYYDHDTDIQIIDSKPCEIYYTTDGSDPDKNQILYHDPIKLIANNDTKANVIKAKAYYNDGSESEIISHIYFVGKNVHERFNTLIFSVTTDPYNLYDYEYGIFVEGKLRNDYIADNPGVKINPDAPANYNIRGMEGEREVYLEVFESDGSRVIAQNAGIRTYGGWSRASEQKSIKIFARKSYDEENSSLRYAFFPNRTDSDGDIIDSYKKLVLRNCGNDNGFAFIRDELFQTLAGQAGYQDFEAVRPAALFVNGEYRGFFWLHEAYGDDYFEKHYGDFDGNFEIIEGGETYKKVDSEDDNEAVIQDYETMYNTYSKKDLTNVDNYKELFKLIDIKNYLSYYAFNIYLGNEDWPHNNYKTYRYYTAVGEEYREAPFDGKWRYLLHDMDFSTGIYGTQAWVDNISNYIGPNGEISQNCPLFGQLMKREDCKEFFITKTLDLLNGAFAPENFTSVLDEMNDSRLNELEHTYGKGLLADWVSYDQLPERLQTLKDYAKERVDHILIKYQEYFDLGDIYTLTIQPVNGCMFKINSFTTDGEFSGSYYTDYDTVITATLPEGKKVDYWLVNGKKIKSEKLVITSAMMKEDKAEVELILAN